MNMARPTVRAGEPTTPEIAEAIERLRNLLFREYGLDYSFIVVGRGATLACSMLYHGVREAVVRKPLKRTKSGA